MAIERYSVGTRVVMVEDHRASLSYGRKGWMGIVTGSFDEGYEGIHGLGGYQVKFDGSGLEWCVNASAVDLLDKGYSDADLVMALELASLLDNEWHEGACVDQWHVATWLREQVFLELKARVR